MPHKANPGQHGPLSINFVRKYYPILPEPFPVLNPMPLINRPNDGCNWIVGNPKDLLCCPAKAVDGKSYCAAHHKRVHLDA